MASKSQICSSCGKAYVAGELFCPLDGTRLQPGPRGESGPAAPGQPAAPAPAAALPPPPPPRALAGGKGSATAAADVSKKHAASKERRDPWIGRIIGGRYRLIAFLGAGGMAAVYLARHEMLGKVLALKLLKPNLPTSTQAMERFRREARTVSLINHENVVYLTDFGETEEGTLYMVMEYLAGKTLAEVLHDEGRLGAARAMAISLQVARALEAAHGVGVIHRDLKPENLMLLDPGSSSEKVKILDFGIAKLLDPEMEKERLTRAGMVFGTPEYMSPEQAMGEELDGRTDLYSLGLILWEMLTGQRCFHGRSATETLAMQVTTPPLRPSQILPEEEISEGLEQVVMCLLEKKRDKRIPSARALVRELVTLRGSRRIKREAEEAHSLAAGVPPAGAAMAAAGAGPAARRIVALPGKSGKGSAGGERQVVPPAREAHAEPDAARASADASPAPAEPPCIEPAAPVDDDKATTPWARKQPLDEHTTPSAQQAEGAACQERLPISQLPTQLLQQGLAAPPATEAGREAAPAADDASAAAERPAPAAALASGSPAEPLPPETPPLPLPPLVPLPMDWLDPLEAPPGEALDGASGDMPQLQGAPDTGKVSSSPPLPAWPPAGGPPPSPPSGAAAAGGATASDRESQTLRRRYRDLLMALARRIWPGEAPPEVDLARSEVARLEDDLLDLATDLSLLDEDLQELRGKASRHEKKAKAQIKESEGRIAQLVKELSPILQQREQLARQLNQIQAEESTLTARLRALEQTLPSADGATVGVGNPEVGMTCARLAMLGTSRDRLHREQHALTGTIEGMHKEIARLRSEQANLSARLEEVKQIYRQEIARLRGTIADREGQVERQHALLQPQLKVLLVHISAIRSSLPSLHGVFGELDQLTRSLG